LIFVLDNYDSFTYNLVQYLMELGARVEVERNDRVTVDDVMARRPAGIVISPGPGRPESAGVTLDLITRASGKVPLLGVCLGHQAIAQAFGGRIVRASRLMHGKTSLIRHDGKGVFEGVSSPFEATRYHSLVVEPGSFGTELVPSAFTTDGVNEVIMGLRHRDYPRVPLEGVQFHPESILTREGKKMLANFLLTVARC
jgi:anthranilate synthase/aminodeoxychorismate synthase-like glutamine amidotransferase